MTCPMRSSSPIVMISAFIPWLFLSKIWKEKREHEQGNARCDVGVHTGYDVIQHDSPSIGDLFDLPRRRWLEYVKRSKCKEGCSHTERGEWNCKERDPDADNFIDDHDG